MNKVELYKSTPHGIRYWSIDPDYVDFTLYIEHGTHGGILQEVLEDVELNNSGREIEEQIDLRMNTRVNGKKDIGYRETIAEAKACEGRGQLGFHRPMLAQRLDKIKSIDYDKVFLQRKYDGHRCLVTSTNTGLIAYSRQGRVIRTIGHILDGMKIPIGETIDGELYCHGVPLQTISSWAKRLQPNSRKLTYIVYDVVQDVGYNERYNFIKHLALGPYAMLAPTDRSVSETQIQPLLRNAKVSGYEGLILRVLNVPYEAGKRSRSLIKVKQFMDAEFRVIDIIPSVEGWARLVCLKKEGLDPTNDENTFKVSAPGTIYQKEQVLKRKMEFIGESVTVEFANFTIKDKPFHPTAIRWKQEI